MGSYRSKPGSWSGLRILLVKDLHIRPSILNLSNYSFPLIPTATRVPVPVSYFALMYRLFGVNDDSLVIGQWMLGALTCALLFIISLKAFGDRRVAVLTSIAWALYVPELWMSNSRFSEPMTAFLLTCLVYVLLVALSTHSMCFCRWSGQFDCGLT